MSIETMTEKALIEEIEVQAAVDFQSGRNNHMTELFCSYGAIVGSFVAAILAANHEVPGVVVAGVAALPGLFAALQRVIDFRGRAEWYFIKAAELKSIALCLRYEGLEAADGSRKFRELEVSMEKQWTQIGKGRRPQDKPAV